MNEPNLIDILRELAKMVKALFVLVLVVLSVFVFVLVYKVFTADPGISARMRDPNCNFLQSALVSVGGHSVHVPALPHTSIRFAYGQVPDNSYVSAVWHGGAFGFCEAFFPANTVADRVAFSSVTATRIATELNLPSSQSIRWLSIGTRGRGAWLNIPDGTAQALIPDMLIEDATHALQHEDGTPWVSYFHSGSVFEDRVRLSASCSYLQHLDHASCGVRLTRMDDGLIFEVWGLRLDELPKGNQKMPPSFIALADRLPLLQDYLQ